MKNISKIALVFLGVIFSSSAVYAAQSNFQITPPPIATPEFSSGQVDKKVSATYVGITGTGITLNGAGGNFIVRGANSDWTALDLSVGLFAMGGKLTMSGLDSTMSLMSIPLGVNLEIQPIKTSSLGMILFGGPMMSLGYSSLDYKYTIGATTYSDTVTTTTTMYGVQGGAQLGVKAGSFTISPFAMVQSQQGTATSSTSSSNSSTSVDIPTFTSTSYGMDVVYRPWNMTLSSMLQEAAKTTDNSGTNEGYKTTVISLSWNF